MKTHTLLLILLTSALLLAATLIYIHHLQDDINRLEGKTTSVHGWMTGINPSCC